MPCAWCSTHFLKCWAIQSRLADHLKSVIIAVKMFSLCSDGSPEWPRTGAGMFSPFDGLTNHFQDGFICAAQWTSLRSPNYMVCIRTLQAVQGNRLKVRTMLQIDAQLIYWTGYFITLHQSLTIRPHVEARIICRQWHQDDPGHCLCASSMHCSGPRTSGDKFAKKFH